MSEYHLKPIVPPSLAAKEKREARKRLLAEVEKRRNANYQRFKAKRKQHQPSEFEVA